ncbi:MAG: arylsulfatase [Candidatus Auribacter fodinae]|jgi:arylsulfatase|uniref:Arylsulfatase n=1 Tax=Candidatus Auribacter fodinae TaxID=2093366 RepID=A0A3A4QUM8_9BACT|nr:MAG: arylsulfatase [Candidatus Auribacter fodinae]
MRRKLEKGLNIASSMGLCLATIMGQKVTLAGEIDRKQLPIKEPKQPHSKILDVRDATPPPQFQVKAPEVAPNVLIILLDDMGFGQPSVFGGPIHMPNADRLAQNGLIYNHFHTTSLSSPTRMALLTGRNHHTCNTGSIMETATSFPGNTGKRPESVAPLAMTLRYNGYSTAQFGKNHETAPWEVSPSGPTDRWPTRCGFDKFYGFMGGETNQWAPSVFEDMTKIELPNDPNYHFMTDMTDQAIKWVQSQKSLTPQKPFFIYFAPGATHAPHHVPKEWIARYKGKFDMGWDKLREETFARQKKLGIIPQDTKLAPKPAGIKDWDQLKADEKKLFARQMEVFAAYAEYADHEIGRLLKRLEDMGQMENTLVFYILGDNGASAEGGANGLFNETSYFNMVPESVEDMLKRIDDLGGPFSNNHFAAGWAVAGSAPFMWTKQVASNYGGTRNGMIVHWPKYIKNKGSIRQQWHHVIDIAPTILEAAGLPQPKMVNGIVQTPIEGVSMLYSFNDAGAKNRHITQYFEMFGNRAIYHDGWFAGTVHRAPWDYKPRATLSNDTWELYDTRNDFSLTNDLASQNPKKLKEMQKLFMKEAEKYLVLPIDDRSVERINPATAGRPDLMAGRTSLTVYDGMIGLSENVFINIKNRSHNIDADLEIPTGGANGVIIAQAGRFGGWSLYVKEGKPVYSYNWLGKEYYTITGTDTLPSGKVNLRFEFDYDGSGHSKGGIGKIFVNDKKVSEGRIDKTQGFMFSADDGTDVGQDGETPVVQTYGIAPPYKFTGEINKVVINLK